MTTDATGGLPARIARILAVDPSAGAIEFEQRWRTWGELSETVAAVAALVDRPGLEVGILLRNRPASVGALLGVLRAGGCVVTINPGRGRDRTRADIAALDLPVVVGEAGDLRDLVPEASRATTVAVDDLAAPLELTTRADRPASARPGVAVRMLTSGTTGPPKRIDLTYPTMERVLAGAKHYESNRDETVRLRTGVAVVNSPLVHLGGCLLYTSDAADE